MLSRIKLVLFPGSLLLLMVVTCYVLAATDNHLSSLSPVSSDEASTIYGAVCYEVQTIVSVCNNCDAKCGPSFQSVAGMAVKSCYKLIVDEKGKAKNPICDPMKSCKDCNYYAVDTTDTCS
jgi:hypothetical protein